MPLVQPKPETFGKAGRNTCSAFNPRGLGNLRFAESLSLKAIARKLVRQSRIQRRYRLDAVRRRYFRRRIIVVMAASAKTQPAEQVAMPDAGAAGPEAAAKF